MPSTPTSLSRLSSSTAILFFAVFVAFPTIAVPQTQAPPGTATSTPRPPTIKVSTRLIEVTVIVQDKHGGPVTSLKKEDFTVLDEGQTQQIAFFSTTAPVRTPLRPLPADVFTNRSDLKGEDPGATIAILFDALNTSFEDQAYARQHILRFLQSVKHQDHVAIFALTDELLTLHDFTQDTVALASSVNRFSPRLLAAFDASHPADFHVPALAGDLFFQSFENHVNNANGEIADRRVADRFGTTYAAILAIANYVAAIPGNKSLVWVSGGIPIHLGSDRIGVPDRDSFFFDRPDLPGNIGDMSALARVLNRANMAIYPIDAHGVDPDDSAPSFLMRQNQRESFRLLADRTGGKAFYGTNDISSAINSAFEDGRYSYTLGFYPSHGVWDGKFRELKVKVPIEGVHLRYRRGYFAFPERTDSRELSITAELQEASRSPLDATTLGVSVRSKPLPTSSPGLVQLQVTLDPRQFLLREEDHRSRGGLDLLFVQKNSVGILLSAEIQHFEVNFAPKEYDFLAKAGLILQRRLAIDPASAELRVVVRDAGSGSLGSVTIPASKLVP